MAEGAKNVGMRTISIALAVEEDAVRGWAAPTTCFFPPLLANSPNPLNDNLLLTCKN